jgi:hypothetical protein
MADPVTLVIPFYVLEQSLSEHLAQGTVRLEPGRKYRRTLKITPDGLAVEWSPVPPPPAPKTIRMSEPESVRLRRIGSDI